MAPLRVILRLDDRRETVDQTTSSVLALRRRTEDEPTVGARWTPWSTRNDLILNFSKDANLKKKKKYILCCFHQLFIFGNNKKKIQNEIYES